MFHLKYCALALPFVAFTCTVTAQITVNGVADKQHYNDRVMFTVVAQPGFSYGAFLNTRPIAVEFRSP